jgi:hypothetical protein
MTAGKKHVSQDRTKRAGQPKYVSEQDKPGRQHALAGQPGHYSESRTIINQDSPVRKAQAGQLRQESPGMIDQAEKLMHNSKSRTARSWVSKDIQQEQAG